MAVKLAVAVLPDVPAAELDVAEAEAVVKVVEVAAAALAAAAAELLSFNGDFR